MKKLHWYKHTLQGILSAHVLILYIIYELIEIMLFVLFLRIEAFLQVCCCCGVCLYPLCVHTRVKNVSIFSTLCTMAAHLNPIRATQRASEHHSFICHSFSPAISRFSAACVWMDGDWVGELQLSLPCFLSLFFSFYTLCCVPHANIFHMHDIKMFD